MKTTNYSFNPKLSLILLLTTLFITLTILLLLQSQTLHQPLILLPLFSSSPSTTTFLSQLRDSVTFLPLKDPRFSYSSAQWFMSSLNDTQQDDNLPEHLFFPSPSSNNRLLCVSAHDHSDGSKNLYALAYAHALPNNATLLRGLTVVSDTHYDYNNLWHGLSSIVPFFAWHEKNECVRPERWVLFHWGELRVHMGKWVKTLAEATLGDQVRVEDFESSAESEIACFERAVVFRHNEGGLGRERREQVYGMMRCKAREYCKVDKSVGDTKRIRLTLLMRDGGRAFKNETAVVGVFEGECRKVEGCVVKVARANNLTFCDQVKLLSETDILVSGHGAQMTNMIFMDKNSSVLEFFPKGWQELAGVGQYVFQWMAGWTGMRHQGQWKDQQGEKCPYDNDGDCFSFYKDGKIGHDEAYFASWMARVLKEVKASKNSTKKESKLSVSCPCS